MTLAKAVVTGTIYRAPEKRFTQNNIPVSSFVMNIGDREEMLMRVIVRRTALDEVVSALSKDDKVLVEGGFRYGDVVYRPVVVDNIPLELTYEPKDIPLARSLDMRRNFSPIKSQGAVGACTAFAITSVYEYILGQKGVRDTLSERYLYYNARVAALRRQGKRLSRALGAGGDLRLHGA